MNKGDEKRGCDTKYRALKKGGDERGYITECRSQHADLSGNGEAVRRTLVDTAREHAAHNENASRGCTGKPGRRASV